MAPEAYLRMEKAPKQKTMCATRMGHRDFTRTRFCGEKMLFRLSKEFFFYAKYITLFVSVWTVTALAMARGLRSSPLVDCRLPSPLKQQNKKSLRANKTHHQKKKKQSMSTHFCFVSFNNISYSLKRLKCLKKKTGIEIHFHPWQTKDGITLGFSHN